MNYAKEIRELKEEIKKLKLIATDVENIKRCFPCCDTEVVAPSKTQKTFEQLTEQLIEQSTKKKITLKEFWDSDENLAIYCETKEQAEKLFTAFDKMGKRWINGDSYLSKKHEPEAEYCYTTEGTCGYKEDFEVNSKIYNFEDVIFPEEPKWTFTEDEKIILRNVPEEYKWITRDKSGGLYFYTAKPKKIHISWGIDFYGHTRYIEFFGHLFQCIKWSDNEPCEFRRYL